MKKNQEMIKGYEFLSEFNSDRFVEVHNKALIASGDRPYNIKNERTFLHIIWQLNEFGKQMNEDPCYIASWVLRQTIQMADTHKPFENGNHRTAWTLAQTILKSFGIDIDASKAEKDECGSLCIFWTEEECIDWFKAKASSEK